MSEQAPKGFSAEAMMAMGVLGVLAILIVPLPPGVLDGFLALNVGLSLLMLLIALGTKRPLDFSVFPSLLLITTLFRLSLNVATTRLILLHGGSGPGAAGHVIEAFGRFAVGGSLIVGGVIFFILLIVNFAVITKGSGRVSEVAARFTLDASLPTTLFHEAVYVLSLVGAPLFLTVFAVGLVVGVLQSATQVNDPAVGALPRLVATVLVCVFLGGWMVQRLASFFTAAVERMAGRPF